jgi:uncharacterized protein YndB with AHSA1/START domain
MDSIEREIVIAAPVERVWAVLTEPEHIAGWFGDSATGDTSVGGELILGWKEHGNFPVVVERNDPPHAFAFRWTVTESAGEKPRPGNSTLVEFTLRPEGDRSRLRVVESGFASLDIPADEQAKHAEGNQDGWRQELDELRAYAEA